MITKSTRQLFVFVPVMLFSWHVSDAQSIDADRVIEAYGATSDGFGSDELLVQPKLRDAFLEHLGVSAADADAERAALLKLLQLRKAGKLTHRATRRGESVDEAVLPAAEIAARVVMDRHRVTSDTMLADPRYRDELFREAEKIRPGLKPYAIGKGVLQLRKTRALRPELVLQVVHWDRRVETYTLDDLRSQLADNQISRHPGVYLFRSDDRYLYIGEAKNLAARLKDHLGGSDRESLARYLSGDEAVAVTIELHIFSPDSPARKSAARRAYESELIRSRDPKFNVRP